MSYDLRKAFRVIDDAQQQVRRVHSLIERVSSQTDSTQHRNHICPQIIKRLEARAAHKYLTVTEWERTCLDVWVVVRQKPKVPLLISADSGAENEAGVEGPP